MELKYIVNNSKYKTIKEVLVAHFKISNRLITKLKKEKSIYLNGHVVNVNTPIKENDYILISLLYEEDNSNIVPKKMELNIIYEDECYLIIDKPFGITVHPSILHYDDSLSNGICYYFNKINLKKKIRPVNRIDKDTSGLVIFAKNEYVQEKLIRQMKTNDFKKEYICVVEGSLQNKKGTINAPIARKENSIIQRCVNSNGANCITHYEVLNELNIHNRSISIVKCILQTGRTHQIRVHMAYIGHPLLADGLYNPNVEYTLIKRQALHSYHISFYHPITGQKVEYISCIPKDFINIKKDRF